MIRNNRASQTKPNITFYAALEAGFTWNETRYNVMKCDCTDFTAFLRASCPTKHTETLYKALELLKDDSDLARWQALDVLIGKGIQISLLDVRG